MEDQISISIYSDTIGRMFKCGQFKIKAGGIVDFHELVVPCRDVVTVTITENDGFMDDGHTVLIPCTPDSDMTFDMKLPKGEISSKLDYIANLNRAAELFNLVNPYAITRPYINMAT